MSKKFGLVMALMAVAIGALGIAVVSAADGFDENGYNRDARIFNGPASGWCLDRGAPANCLGIYSNDHLKMKWNAEWDRGNAEGWSNPPYAAWEDNQWNGNVPGGSGTSEHFRTVWDQGCVDSGGVESSNGAPCIWGQFEVLMDHGKALDGTHEWWSKANPAGNGAN